MSDIFFVYLLCCWRSVKAFKKGIPKHGHLIYTGQTNNIKRRLLEHLTGESDYGKRKRPYFTKQFGGLLQLVYIEAYETREIVLYRETQIKRMKRDEKIKMIQERTEFEIQLINDINKSCLEELKERSGTGC